MPFHQKIVALAAAAAVAVALAPSSASAYLHATSALGTSHFTAGSSSSRWLQQQQPSSSSSSSSSSKSQPLRQQQRRRAVVEAKKGKPNVPINQRGDYMQKQRMQDQMAAMKPEAGGYPLFNLYVQTPRANMWYPCGTLKGDDRSKSLVDGWIQNGLGLGGMIKGNLDKSVASSLYAQDDSIKKLSDQIVKTYPALKKAKKEFIFGYKIEYENLEEKQEVTILTKELADGGMFDGIRNAVSRFGVGGGN